MQRGAAKHLICYPRSGGSMNLLAGARLALENLRSHKLRTFLTLLGNSVGVMSVIAVVSLINGVDIYTRQVVLEEGTDVFTITRINPIEFLTDTEAFIQSLSNPDLTLADRDFLLERLELARVVGAAQATVANLKAGSRAFRGAVVRGKTEDYALLEDIPLVDGRHLTRQDLLGSRQVAVIGWEIARDLFPRLPDPTGCELKIGDRHFTVVGVAADRGTVMGNNRNQFLIIPLTAYQKLFGADESVDIKIAAADLQQIEDAKDEARTWLRVRHRLRPASRDDFSIQTSEQLLGIWRSISGRIYAALVPLVGISLVVGGIVLMNIMLVSVTERTREIGIRKAIGANRLAILWQFLIESITLSLVGGTVGILSGFLLAFAISQISPLPFAMAVWSVLLGLAVTFVIGLVFGTYPAWKAAGLDPVEALRHE
jgi:putative ABC transport system permease protein